MRQKKKYQNNERVVKKSGKKHELRKGERERDRKAKRKGKRERTRQRKTKNLKKKNT